MLNIKKISFILATIVMSVIAGYLVFAWSEPTATPPGANVPAPINVGTATQHKAGEIGATLFRDRDNTAWFVDPAGNSMFQGNVGIGTTTPAAPLHVTGNVIAAAPTASNHVATRGWVEAQTGGGTCYTAWGISTCATGFSAVFTGRITFAVFDGTNPAITGPYCSSQLPFHGGSTATIERQSAGHWNHAQDRHCVVCCR